jgi:hypothetical protein
MALKPYTGEIVPLIKQPLKPYTGEVIPLAQTQQPLKSYTGEVIPLAQTQQPQQPGQPKVLKDGEGSDFTRGLGTYWDQIGGIFGGAQVLAGKAIDSDEQVMAGLERMQESEKAIGQRGTKASDSFTEAWEQGIGTVLTEFIPFIAGQGVGMVGEALATSIAGGMIGTAVAPGAGTAAGVLTGLVGKSLLKKGILEAAKDMSREEAKEFIKREAAKELASPAGQALIKKQYRDAGKKIALGGMAAKFGAGEVTGRAVDEAIANTDDPEEQLKIIQELNTGKLAGLSAAHALTDFFAIKIGLGSLDKLNPGSSSKLVNIVRNIGVTGLKEAPIEAAQTVLERMGADLDLTSQAAIKEYIDAAAAGFAMPIIPATIGGLRTPTNTTNPNAAKEAEEINPITGEPTKVTDNKGWSRTAEETKRQKENAKTATSVEDIDVNVDLNNANVIPTPIAAPIEALITEENFNLEQIIRDKKISSNLKFATKELAQKAIALDPSLSMQYKVVINNDGTYRVEDNLGGGGEEGEEENVGLDNANVIPTPIKPPSEIPSIEEAKVVEGQIPLNKEQYADINSRKEIYETLSKRFKTRSPDEAQGGTPTQEKNVSNQRVREFDERVGRVPGYKKLASEALSLGVAIPQFLKTGASFGSVRAPIVNATSIDDLFNAAMGDFIYETVADDIIANKKRGESANVFLVNAYKQDLARRKKLRDQFYNSPLFDAFLKRNNIEKNRSGFLRYDTSLDALVEKQKIKTRAANAYGDGRQILSSLAQTQRAINNEIKIIEDKKRNRLTAEELAVQEDLTDIAADLGISQPGTSNLDEMYYTPTSIMGESKATTILKTSNNLQEALQRILAIQEQRLQTYEKNNDARANLIKAQTYLIERLMSVPGMQNVQVDAVSEAEMRRIQKKDPSTKASSGLSIGYNKEAPNEPNKVMVLENYTSAQTIRILLHEAVHAATVFGLNTNRLTQAEQQNWNAIFNTAKEAARLEGVSFYGLKNIKEFVAEAFSSTEFQQWLSSIESVSNQPTNKYVSLFDDFVQAVKDLLGLGDINNTLLGDVVTASGRLFTFGPQPRQGDPRTEVIEKKMNWVKRQDRLDQGANPDIIDIFYPDSEVLELDAYEGDDDFLVTKIRRKPLTETQVRKTRSEKERLQDLTDVHERTTRNIFKKIWNFAARGNLRKQENVERIITNFSNKAYSVKKWQDDLRQSNLLLVGVEGFNDVFNQLTRAFGLADNYMKGLMAPLDKYGQDLAAFEDLYIQQNPGATQASARAYLQDTLTGLHEFERRQVRYILDAPLRTDKIIQLANGKTISPADLRVDIMKVITTKTWADPNERLNALKGYKEQLIKLTDPTTKISGQPTLDAIAGKSYLSDKVGGSIDIFSSSYDVSSLNAQTAESIRSRFKLLEASNPALYNSMNAVKNSMGVISTATKDLNAMGNYANQQALNIIDFYGWDNYIPLKSKRDQDSTSEDIARILDPTSTRLSRSLKKLESSFEGNQQDAEQPFTQVIVDASLAAARAGRINYTQSIYNAITSEIDYQDSSGDKKKARAIDGSVKIFSYEQRYKNDPDIQEALAKQNTIIHFLDDGGMAVMTINDKKLLRAIREPLADKTTIIDIMNTITGSIGQLHTRFNPPFAPLNFVRDAITDIFLIGTDYGLKEAGGFIQNVANTIVKGGLIDTWKISSMYNQGKLKELDAFVATEKRKGNTYPETMVEYLNKGGIVSYSQALSNETAYQRIENMINRGKIFRSKESIKTFFDTYMATFELSTRVAAFSIIKDNYIAKNAPGKTGNSVPENVRRAAVEEATVYAKRLSNFEEIGEMGRTAGAFFMYFRPSAVGATRALESIAPALRNKAEVQATLPEYIRRSPERLAAWSADFDRRRSAGQGMIMGGLGFGMAMYYLSAMLAPGDDDEGENKILNDDLARWTRYARFDLSGLTGNKKDVIQIPWGFGLGGIPAIGAQMAGLISSNENTPASIFGNVIGITLDSFLPLPISRIDPTKHPMIFIMDSVVPTAARPMFEFMINKNAFGQGIYNELATKRFGSAYQAGDNVPQMYKDASIALAELTDGAVDWSPNIMHFFGNNYIDGVTKIGQNLYGMQLALRGQKEFTPKGDLLLLDSFFSKYSDLDQRAYSRTVTDIENLEAKINLFKDTNPYEYNNILAKNPFAPTVIDYYNGMKSTLNDLNKQANIIRKQPGLNAKERSLRLEGIKDLQLVYKRNITAQIQMALEYIE